MEKKTEISNCKTIIVTGPESTGKTTVAKYLSEKYNGYYFPELAREYVEKLGRKYNYRDIVHIAEKQKEQFENAMSLCKDKTAIFDTYLIITKIWMVWNSGRYETWIDEMIEKTNQAVFLLCTPDLEWQADNVRENGGEKRIELFNLYREELENFDLNYSLIEGNGTARFDNAERVIKEYLTK
jgi:NadR type nicotinamide-nucleotide adenylyltransferase